jgi:hypothetical protein
MIAGSSFWRVLTVVYYTYDYLVSGRHSYLVFQKEHNFSASGVVSFIRWKYGEAPSDLECDRKNLFTISIPVIEKVDPAEWVRIVFVYQTQLSKCLTALTPGNTSTFWNMLFLVYLVIDKVQEVSCPKQLQAVTRPILERYHLLQRFYND